MQHDRPVQTFFTTVVAGASTLALVVLVAFNLVPLIGVLFWGWSMMLILVLYWLENGVIGVINIFKIATAHGAVAGSSIVPVEAGRLNFVSTATKAVLIPFFCLHYGMFWVGHGIFLFLLPVFAGAALATGGAGASRFGDFGSLEPGAIIFGLLALTATHVTSFFLNWIGRGEYLSASPLSQMGSVYGRVVILHITILLGAFAIALLGTPVAALALLVLLKAGLDVTLHLREHRRARVSAP